MRLILWTLGSLFAAAGLVQIAIEGMLAVLAGSWTRLVSLSDLVAMMSGPGGADWMPPILGDAPPWVLALILGALFLYLGRYRRPTQGYV